MGPRLDPEERGSSTSAVNTSAGISDSRADNDNARDGTRLLFGLEGPGSGLNVGKTQK